ncbi:DUF975 family protein [Fodinisporobacter ferrooxydans]|uniref:DUF975 family protein n=1 Tax=Fodinisporobacter ferrooxydans TaxID=2901836 RepID=A0ABY4CKE1_9BACL|nr:DUF975 family protein [Alicyclobacillaceae bacterium MYW30-H2]
MKLSLLRSKARSILKGKWFSFVGYTILLLILNTTVPKLLEKLYLYKGNLGMDTVLSFLYEVLVIGALTLGSNSLYLKITKDEKASVRTIFSFFSNFNSYKKAIIYNLLMGLYFILWSLLLIIPGIIKSFSYAMSSYILIEEPHLTANQAITKSRQMMDGYKWKLFCLYLSFAGWFILSILTVGIGFLWLIPYYQTSIACFYNDIKDKYKVTEPNSSDEL